MVELIADSVYIRESKAKETTELSHNKRGTFLLITGTLGVGCDMDMKMVPKYIGSVGYGAERKVLRSLGDAYFLLVTSVSDLQ